MGYRDSDTILSLDDLVRTIDNKDIIRVNKDYYVKDIKDMIDKAGYMKDIINRTENKNVNTIEYNRRVVIYKELRRLLKLTL